MAASSTERSVLPAAEEKAVAVRRMFHSIAPRYDLLNHLLSLNLDTRWRRRAVDLLLRGGEPRGRFLDACAGTLDLALELARRPAFEGTVVASDFTFEMLRLGQPKVGTAPVTSACADALRLPFPDAAFDGATVGFGIRNVAGLDDGLRELRRVLRPGGRLVILEFAVPTWQPFRGLYLFYFRHVLPAIGRMISRHGTAYSYLPESVMEFPSPESLAERMRAARFGGVEWETYFGGIVAAHVGTAR